MAGAFASVPQRAPRPWTPRSFGNIGTETEGRSFEYGDDVRARRYFYYVAMTPPLHDHEGGRDGLLGQKRPDLGCTDRPAINATPSASG